MCIFAFTLSASAALAECPEPADHSDRLEALIQQAQEAPSETDGRSVSNKMWELWTDAPDPVAQEMLDRGMRKREVYDFLGARQDFDQLVEYCPDYAEGYNQRAFVAFLRQEYSAALPDLDKALQLSPNHVAALAGRALTLMQLGRVDEARTDLSAALVLNPWLSERHLMAKGGPLEIPGEDI